MVVVVVVVVARPDFILVFCGIFPKLFLRPTAAEKSEAP